MTNQYLVSISLVTRRMILDFGIIVCDGVVTEAAPIAKQHIGKQARAVVLDYKNRGATIVVRPDPLAQE